MVLCHQPAQVLQFERQRHAFLRALQDPAQGPLLLTTAVCRALWSPNDYCTVQSDADHARAIYLLDQRIGLSSASALAGLCDRLRSMGFAIH